ncbi:MULTISPECIES: NAD(P)/FAD-dependent oxidoreductase [unclassified Saccharopolyspora]|uniref:protoporphyrinogen/coproporphyrinogen oxidase n=1 Tax=unclassified Saccharopolyspora TaxID=2646250 RepID=UPI001CD1A4C8|nr:MULTISPECIES: NAD(P)/FAD-dependent oxidoreductase [unclassified Saccharopolyspora]MCA1184993.1 FAD-dependent oxidoreductase [Saccharopolyspora sp. 6T]MCA1190715.1 FAD-dependent oxidoreductase [Saccharopolyspora sp. 6V]MCA1225497.1 FAD-dependent oxidoreductase [Saccharopolyspora sp. 6M]MCA1278179.1 FAD-dependent oxidoreductase [Saccharopolyspora sp. 7B]
MKDAIVIGAGLAGLSAAWRLRHWDALLLEADERVGGRIRSERRGRYWLNWGGHVFAGADSSTDALLNEIGVAAMAVPGSLQALAMNGKFLKKGHIATYPFRIPMPTAARIGTVRAGLKVVAEVARYTGVVRKRPGESGAARQQRIYDFANDRSFQDFVGNLPEDAAALFRTTVTRSAGDMDQISAGAGIGYFSLVLGFGQGLSRGIVGGPSTLTETISAALGDRVRLGAAVQEIVRKPGSVVVRYRQDGVDHEVEARTVVLATTADVSHRIGVDLPAELRDALGRIEYGPHVSSAFLTDETSARPWDDIYAIAAPKRSFAIALNQANLVRGTESARQPGGSFMTFSPASLGRALLDKSDDEVVGTHLADLDQILGHGFADTVVEAEAERWAVASPYSFPGRAKLQSTLTRGADRVFLAGDYLGTLYTESAITSGFSAAQEAASLLATERRPHRAAPAPAVV